MSINIMCVLSIL